MKPLLILMMQEKTPASVSAGGGDGFVIVGTPASAAKKMALVEQPD